MISCQRLKTLQHSLIIIIAFMIHSKQVIQTVMNRLIPVTSNWLWCDVCRPDLTVTFDTNIPQQSLRTNK